MRFLRSRLSEFSRSESGSEPASFALITPLMLILILGIMQLSLVLWVHTTLIDAAGAGAHAAAMVGAGPDFAQNAVRGALSSTIGEDYIRGISVSRVPVTSVSNKFTSSPLEVIEVEIDASIPVLGLFSVGKLTAVGHAMAEVGS